MCASTTRSTTRSIESRIGVRRAARAGKASALAAAGRTEASSTADHARRIGLTVDLLRQRPQRSF
jgi:ribosomal protein L13E